MLGGGTGGHVIPLLAVARELRKRGRRVWFIGTERGLEARLVPAEGFDVKFIRIGGLNRVGLRKRLSTLCRLPIATAACFPLLHGAAAVLSIGGYAAGPPVVAALARRIPVVIMEPNAVPGFTNRVIGRFAFRALINFPETAAGFPGARTELTGIPIREEFFRIAPKPRASVLSVLITGGSQGSRTLNQAARESWPLLKQSGVPVRTMLQTGPAAFEPLRDDFAKTGLAGEVAPFIADMPAAFAAADVVVSRSGASTVSELAAAGKPSVLIPFPFAADDHQTRNAEAMERAGASRLVRDSEMTGAALAGLLADFAGTTETLEFMGRAARVMAKPGAAVRAADILEEAARLRADFR